MSPKRGDTLYRQGRRYRDFAGLRSAEISNDCPGRETRRLPALIINDVILAPAARGIAGLN